MSNKYSKRWSLLFPAKFPAKEEILYLYYITCPMKKLFLFLFFISFSANGQIITTFAGGGMGGDGSPATAASFTNPHYIAFDRFGNLFISDFTGCRIRKIDTAGIIKTVVGPGTFSVIGDGGPATAAFVKYPEGITCDTFGNLFIADHQNYRIRKVDVFTGIISTIAGTGISSLTGTGDGGPATAAEFYTPADVKFDKRGNLYVSDNSAHTIRRISPAGIITSFAGIGHSPGFSGDGGPASAAQLNHPAALAIDDTGNMYVADQQNKRVRKIDTFGIITTVAGSGVAVYSGDGIPAKMANVGPICIWVFNNNIYITDSNERVRKVDATGIIHTIAGIGISGYSGDGGPATSAEMYGGGGGTTDKCGNVYFSDVDNLRIRKVTFNTACDPSDCVLMPEYILLKSTSVYPNPVTKELIISSAIKVCNIAISNVIGQTIYSNKYNSDKVQIDVSGLASGVYFVKVNGSEVRKFVKQ